MELSTIRWRVHKYQIEHNFDKSADSDVFMNFLLMNFIFIENDLWQKKRIGSKWSSFYRDFRDQRAPKHTMHCEEDGLSYAKFCSIVNAQTHTHIHRDDWRIVHAEILVFTRCANDTWWCDCKVNRCIAQTIQIRQLRVCRWERTWRGTNPPNVSAFGFIVNSGNKHKS